MAVYRCFVTLTMLMALSVFVGCASDGEDEVKGPLVVEGLRRGETVQYPSPLPSMTPIYLDETEPPRLGFRAWDFSGNGHFGEVEVLDEQGKVILRLFDLDFDGIADWQRVHRGVVPSQSAE